jgi:hypothetical protein
MFFSCGSLRTCCKLSEHRKMDLSDSVCVSILLASTGAPLSLLADPLNFNITETQFCKVRDQRMAIAAKIHAKFQVANAEHENIVRFDPNVGAQKFVTFDPSDFEPYKQLSCQDYFNASDGIQSIANLIRRTIQEDLIAAHADQVCKLSKDFHRREGMDLERLCYAGSTPQDEKEDEQYFKFDTFERHEKFLMFDFDTLECEGGFTVSDQSCMIVNEGCDCRMDEKDTVQEGESILKMQFQIIQDLRQAEGSMPTVIDDFFEAAETMTSALKFICAPPLEDNVYGYNHGTTFLHAEMFGVCTSLMMTLAEDSTNVDWPTHPIIVVADNGIQNYLSLVETCTPSDLKKDECDYFPLLTLEAFLFEPCEDISIR